MGRGANTSADAILYGDELLHSSTSRAASQVLGDERFLEAFDRGQMKQIPAPYMDSTPKFQGLAFISGSALLADWNQNGREYRCHIAVGRSKRDNTAVFFAVYAHGKAGKCGSQGGIIKEDESLDAVVKAANKRLEEKLNKGYQPTSSGPTCFDLETVRQDIEVLLRS